MTGGGIGHASEDAPAEQSIFDNIHGKFTFSQIPQVSIGFVDCSVGQKQIDNIYLFLLSRFA